MIFSDVALTCGGKAWKRPCRTTGNARLPLDAIFPDCCFSRGQCCICDKTAHASAFDFGSLIDEFAFIIGEVDECFFSEARLGSATRCGRRFFCHKQMVPLNFLPLSCSTGAVHKGQRGHQLEVGRWVTRRVDQNEYKRKQAPPSLKVTSNACGVGGRSPLAQKFVV
jgi:hypothetical protein